MMSTYVQIRQSLAKPGRRIFAALTAVALFGVLFLLPLYIALTLCSMPCCHPHQRGSSVATADRTGCAAECAIVVEQATRVEVISLAPEKSVERSSPLVIALPYVPANPRLTPAIQRDTGPIHTGADTPLHVLNSIFRI